MQVLSRFQGAFPDWYPNKKLFTMNKKDKQ